MSLAQPGLTDDHLAISLINVPEKSLILFEDIDCLFSDRVFKCIRWCISR